MSVEDKTRFVKEIRNKLSSVVTASNMDAIIDVIMDTAGYYDLTRVSEETNYSDDMLESFLNALTVEGRSPKTIKRYRYIVKKLLDAINIPSNNITVFDIRKFLSKEKMRGISDCTLEGNRQIYSCYFGWLHREGIIKSNPVANIGSIKCMKKVRDAFSDVDIELLKKSCKTNRDVAIIMFLLSTGCRISEVTSLNRDAVNLTTLECKVIGKGNKERIVYLDEVAGMFLQNYLNSRHDDNDALFIGKRHERITPSGVRAMLKELENKSGVQNVHPHKFRRTLATNLIKHGMPIESVAAILGHEKLDTTMKYVVLDFSDIKYAYAKYA